jgi:hypothetical protein
LDDAAQTPRRNHAPTRSAPHRRQRRLNSKSTKTAKSTVSARVLRWL